MMQFVRIALAVWTVLWGFIWYDVEEAMIEGEELAAQAELAPPVQEGTAPTRPEDVHIPHNAATARFAREIMDRINGLHYSLKAIEVSGFVSEFVVQKDGVDAGTFSARWDREEDYIYYDFDGQLEEAVVERLEDIGYYGLRTVLAVKWESEGSYAMEFDDKILNDDASGRQTRDEAHHVDFIEKDLTAWHHIVVDNDGTETGEGANYQKSGERAYTKTYYLTKKAPEEPDQRRDYTFKYTREPGHPFVSQMAVTETVGDQTTQWLFRLKSAELRTYLTPEVKLAREVMEKMDQNHYSLWTRDVDGFEAVFSVRHEAQSFGPIRYKWDRAKGTLTGKFEGNVPADFGREWEQFNGVKYEEWIEDDSQDWLWDAVLLGYGDITGFEAKAKRHEGTIVMLQTDPSGEDSMATQITVLSPEFHVISVERRLREGQSYTRTFEHMSHDGKLYKKGITWTIKDADGTKWERRLSYMYGTREGHPFPTSISVDTTAVGEPFHLGLELVSVSFTEPEDVRQEGD